MRKRIPSPHVPTRCSIRGDAIGAQAIRPGSLAHSTRDETLEAMKLKSAVHGSSGSAEVALFWVSVAKDGHGGRLRRCLWRWTFSSVIAKSTSCQWREDGFAKLQLAREHPRAAQCAGTCCLALQERSDLPRKTCIFSWSGTARSQISFVLRNENGKSILLPQNLVFPAARST